MKIPSLYCLDSRLFQLSDNDETAVFVSIKTTGLIKRRIQAVELDNDKEGGYLVNQRIPVL